MNRINEIVNDDCFVSSNFSSKILIKLEELQYETKIPICAVTACDLLELSKMNITPINFLTTMEQGGIISSKNFISKLNPI